MESSFKKEALSKLAKRVKELRLNKGVSQQDAFNDTGIHFGRIEQGKRNISYTTLCKICDYFNLKIKDFFKED